METFAVEQPTAVDSSASKKKQRSEFKKAVVKILSCIVNELVGPECFSSTEVDSTVASKATGTSQEPIQQQPLPTINQLTQALAATRATGAVSSDSLPPGAVFRVSAPDRVITVNADLAKTRLTATSSGPL